MGKKVNLKKPRFAVLLILSLLFAGKGDAWSFGKNKVQYKQFHWSYIQSPHFDIYYYEGGKELASFAASAAEEAYLRISDDLKYQPRKRIPLIVYNSLDDFQQTNVVPEILEEGVQGFTEQFKNRVVVHFTGSWREFRQLITHELTHAFTNDMLYGGAIGSLLTRGSFFQLPLWVAEGYAEFASRGWDTEADMVVRDAIINDYIIPLEEAGGYLVYKEGQSVMNYIAHTYGREKVGELITNCRLKRDMDKALKATLGIDLKRLNKRWVHQLKKDYWPEISCRKEGREVARQLTDHTKDGSYLNLKPAFSPQGDKIAFFSNRSDYTDIYLISSISGKILGRLVKGERSGGLEELHSFRSGICWSPDGRVIGFVAKSKGRETLCLLSIEKKRIIKKYDLGLDGLFSPSWSPKGKLIALSGLKNGQSDIYLLRLSDGNLQKITDDLADDREPSWSPDGEQICFSSDRDSVSADTSSGQYDLFIYQLNDGDLRRLTISKEDEISPCWSPDGENILFISDRNGIYNLYQLSLDSGSVSPLTDLLTGCFSPSISPDGKRIALSLFSKGGWDIYILSAPKPLPAQLKPTKTINSRKKEKYLPKPLVQPSPSAPELKLESLETYVFKPPNEEETQPSVEETTTALSETTSYKPPNGEYRTKPYKTRFTPDLITATLGYDTYFGLQGQSFIQISDVLGNHSFLLASDLYYSLTESNFFLFYTYLPHRCHYGGGLFHYKEYYIDEYYRLFSDRVYGFSLLLSYPFSKFTRADFELTNVAIDRTYYDPPYEDSYTKVFLPAVELTNDTALWGYTGPINGTRSYLRFEFSPPGLRNSLRFYTLQGDYRRYLHFLQRYGFAFRLSGGGSWGPDAQMFFLGGTQNWIAPTVVHRYLSQVKSFYFSSMVFPLRGYNYYELAGNKFALANIEFRYPFLDYLAFHWPLKFNLRGVRGNLFLDVGGVWNEASKFKGGTSKDDNPRLKDLKVGFGYGARANLGLFVLKFDAAWKTDLSQVSKPKYYFSLGTEF